MTENFSGCPLIVLSVLSGGAVLRTGECRIDGVDQRDDTFAQRPGTLFPGFILIQQPVQAGNCIIITALLFGQYSITRTPSLDNAEDAAPRSVPRVRLPRLGGKPAGSRCLGGDRDTLGAPWNVGTSVEHFNALKAY